MQPLRKSYIKEMVNVGTCSYAHFRGILVKHQICRTLTDIGSVSRLECQIENVRGTMNHDCRVSNLSWVNRSYQCSIRDLVLMCMFWKAKHMVNARKDPESSRLMRVKHGVK